MTAVQNNTANVSVGKGVVGGYFFSAPTSATLPTDYSTSLSADYVNLGYITSDGLVISESTETSDFNDINGDIIETSRSSREETMQVTFAERKAATQKELYGQSNVTDSNGMVTIKHTNAERDERIYVFEAVYKNGRRGRIVACKGKVTDLGDETLASGNLAVRQCTIKCMVGSSGWSVIEYLQSTETSSGVQGA
ncbi:MAG: hypothetical protein IKP01_02200 [Bacteroidales bacterium]|nr:hypothetical protein [Bacteroidales bacterium]